MNSYYRSGRPRARNIVVNSKVWIRHSQPSEVLRLYDSPFLGLLYQEDVAGRAICIMAALPVRLARYCGWLETWALHWPRVMLSCTSMRLIMC